MSNIDITRRRFILAGAAVAMGTVVLRQNAYAQNVNGGVQQMSNSNFMPTSQNTDGNSLYLFAASNYMNRPDRIGTGIQNLERAGFKVSNQQALQRRYLRFAGTVEQRAQDFNSIIQNLNQAPKFMLGVRGGYGSMQVLPQVDWVRFGQVIKQNQTVLMGFSDVTAVQLAMFSHSQTPYFQGPMFQSDFANPNVSYFTMNSFVRCMSQSHFQVQVNSPSIPKKTRAIIWGGNLSVLVALIGTPYMPKVEGGILFLEDVSEPIYRIERMLLQLHLAGILQKQQAVILGALRSSERADSYDSSYTLDRAISYISQISRVPFYRDFPFGHIKNKSCIPLGIECYLDANSNGYTVNFENYPYLNSKSLNLQSLLSASGLTNDGYPSPFNNPDQVDDISRYLVKNPNQGPQGSARQNIIIQQNQPQNLAIQNNGRIPSNTNVNGVVNGGVNANVNTDVKTNLKTNIKTNEDDSSQDDN